MKKHKHGFSMLEILVTLTLFHLIFLLSLTVDQYAMQAVHHLNRLTVAFSQQQAYQSGIAFTKQGLSTQNYWKIWDERNQLTLPDVLIQKTNHSLIFFWNKDQPDCDAEHFNAHCVGFFIS